jgi:O-methyltransferase involved in polyketide biosynthesis
MSDTPQQRLPMATRWSLFALGQVEGQRVRTPPDPVAAWLLLRHPDLRPAFAAPSILSMIRARAHLVDRIILDTIETARRAGERRDFWSFGSGFDARWHRLMRNMEDVITSHREVDEPGLLAFKDASLADSDFASSWERVALHPTVKAEWTAHPSTPSPLIVLEGVSTRIGRQRTLELLARLRRDAPGSTVVLDLPGYLNASFEGAAPPPVLGSVRARWSSAMRSGAAQITTRELRESGYLVTEDYWFSARPELRSPSGVPICSGTEAFRVLVLEGETGS